MRIETAVLLLVVGVLISTTTASAQTATIALGSPVIASEGVSLGANWSPDTSISTGGLQFVLNYNSAAFAGVSITTGPAAAAAGKTAYCSVLPGAVACVIEGMNTNALPAGVVAQFSFTFAPGSASSRTIQISSALASSVSASAEAVTVPIQPFIIQTQPAITWPTPAAIFVGQALTGTQLDATANVPGTFSYSPKLGTVLPVGLQPLTAIFTPADTITYSSATATALLTVNALPTMPTLLSCSPASLGPNTSSTCTVSLNQAAPAGGAAVTLSNTNAALIVPPSVTVAGGSTTGTFTVTTANLTTTQSATIAATLNGISTSTTVSLVALTTPTLLSCAPASLGPNASSTCTVTLNQAAPVESASVTLSTTNAALTVPASVTLAGGSATGTFTVTTANLSASQSATIAATLNGISTTAIVSLVASTTPTSLNCSPASLGQNASGTCTVSLNQAAPAGGAAVTLSTTNPALTVPPSVTIASGSTAVQFNVTTANLSSSQSASITATLNGISANATISLVALTTPTTMNCDPASLGPNSSGVCSVTLNQVAPAGGASITLSNNDAALTIPASVAVAGGSATGTFTFTTGNFITTHNAAITATLSNASASFTVGLVALTTPTSLSCAPASMGPNASSTCTVTLNQAAQAGGASVILSNTNTVLTVPPSVAVVAGSTTGTFIVTTASLTTTQSATITATFGGASQGVTLTLLATPTLTSLACSTSQFLVGIPAICTVTLSSPGGAIAIAVASTNAAVTLPANVAVLAGVSTATFAATAQTLVPGWIVLSASLNGLTKSAVVTVSQPSSESSTQSSVLHGISCRPKILAIGSRGLCRVDLSRVNDTSSTELRLSSSTDSVKIPATVVSRPGQWSVEFQIEPVASVPEHSAVIAVQLGSDTIAETVEVPSGRSASSKIPHHIISESGRRIRFGVYSSEFTSATLAASLPFGSVFDPASGNFQWTPGKNQEGVYDLAFDLTGPESDAVTEHVAIEVYSGLPTAIRVVNAASHSRDNVCSPGALASVEGRWLTAGPSASDPSGSSVQLSGTSVAINGNSVPVLYASPQRVDFQCPVAPPGTRLSIIVETEQGASQPLETVAHSLVPGVFSADGSGSGQGVVTHVGSSTLAMVPNYRYAAQAAQTDDQLVVDVTGVDGAMGIFVNIAGIEIIPNSVNPIPARAGISQISFTLPKSASPGTTVLFITAQSWDGTFVSSNVTTIAIER